VITRRRALRCGRVHRLRQTKVQELDETIIGHFDIGGLQVAMNDPALMSGIERIGNLCGDASRLCERHGFGWHPADDVGQRVALDQFEHECVNPLVLFQPMDAGDVGMVERSQRTRLSFETGQSIGVESKRRGQRLECDVALEAGVAGAIHLAHSTFAELREDLVRAKSNAGAQGHTAGL
jgi:hypothetical protein